MKLLDKIKNAIFEEEEEFEEEFVNKTPVKQNKDNIDSSTIVKKIDIEKTIPKKSEIKEEPFPKEEVPTKKEMKRERRTPVIFDEEDFVLEEPKREIKPKIEKHKEETKSLYGGYKDDKPKDKFKPSPIISPVYGFVGVSPVLEHARPDDTGEQHIFVSDKTEELSLDLVRQKAFGEKKQDNDKDDDLGLLYEMKKDDSPAISKITLGDAEEYFEDLGLEYNIDYKDDTKEKASVKKEIKDSSTTRSTKNKKLSDKVTDEIKKEKELESTKDLEITKEQLKPKTAKEIKKVKKIEDADLGMNEDKDEADEKNLYDLIDMMYDSK